MTDPLDVPWTVFECESCHTEYRSILAAKCVLP